MRPFSFALTERAIQLLLGCQRDAESFLAGEHSLVGEMEDALAQAYATLGMTRVFILCSEEQVCHACLVMTLAYLLVLRLKLFSLLLSFPHPENVHPQLTVVLSWNQIFVSLQGTGESQLPIYRRVSEWLRLGMGRPVLKWVTSSSNWPNSFSTGKSFSCFLTLSRSLPVF